MQTIPKTRQQSKTRQMFRNDAELYIRKMIGKRYQVMGRGPESYDCWGVILGFFRHNGYKLPDIWTNDPSELMATGAYHYVKIINDPDFGDIALFGDHTEDHFHVGILTFDGIVTATIHGVIIIPSDRSKVRRYYRYRFNDTM
jgi:hypothetical protein